MALYDCVVRNQWSNRYWDKGETYSIDGVPPATYFTAVAQEDADGRVVSQTPLPAWRDAEDDWHVDVDLNLNGDVSFANEVSFDDGLTVDQIILNTDHVVTGSEVKGSLFWDTDNETASLSLKDGIVGQLLEEQFIQVQNDTGATLKDGTVATYVGSIGSSGNIRAEGTVAVAAEHPMLTLGIVTADILNGDRGKVTTFGKVRGMQTDGANYGETWVDGDILYKSSTVAGGLTNVMPEAPVPGIPLAVVIAAHPTNGTIIVRPTVPSSLTELTDVNGTPLTASGQILVWDQVNGYFDFTENVNSYVQGAAGLTTQYSIPYVSAAGTLTESSGIITDAAGALLIGAPATSAGEVLGVAGDTYLNGMLSVSSETSAGDILISPSNASLLLNNTNTGVGARYGVAWHQIAVINDTLAAIQPTVLAGWDTHLDFFNRQSGGLMVGARLSSSGAFLVGITVEYAAEKLGVAGAIYARGSITADVAATQDAISIAGRAGGTGSYKGTITPSTLTASRTWTMPDVTGTVAMGGDNLTTQYQLAVVDAAGVLTESTGISTDASGSLKLTDDNYIYLRGDGTTDGSVRFSYQAADGSIVMQSRASGTWTTKHSFSM